MTDVERMTYMLEEAFRCLSRHTGMRNWDKAIASRVDLGVQSKTCPACGGDGRVTQPSTWGEDIDPISCTECSEKGYILVPLDRIELIKLP